MSIRRLYAIARKEFFHITRDARMAFLVTLAPAFLLVTFSYVFATDVGRIDVAVRDMDQTALSRDLVGSLTGDKEMVVVAHPEHEDDVESLFDRGSADLLLSIPRGFAAEALGGGPATAQCLVDGADAIAAGQAVERLESRLMAFALKNNAPGAGTARQGIDVNSRAWYNGTLDSLVSMVPGIVAVIQCMPALALALAFTREKETGSFEGLMATPVRGVEYVVGKILAYELCGLASVVLVWLVATLWFGVPFRGNLPVFILLAADYLLATMGVSMLVANFVQQQQTAILLVLMLFFVPSLFVAGLFVPVADNLVARLVASVLPATHFIIISRGVFLKGLGLAALQRPALSLLATGAFCCAVSLALFRKRIT